MYWTKGGEVSTTNNSLFAGNTGGNTNRALISQGYNLSDDGSLGFTAIGDRSNTPAGMHGAGQQRRLHPHASRSPPAAPRINAANPSTGPTHRPARHRRLGGRADIGALEAVASGELWFTTAGAATSAGGTGWSTGNIERFGDAGDTFDINAGLTSGTISLLAGYTAPVPIRALDFVQSTITIGTTGAKFTLRQGDLLMVMDAGKGATVNLGNGVVAGREDIVVYRPTTAGNYASGTYTMLLQGGAHLGTTTYNVHALSLIETDTMVGGKLLTAGTFVMAHSDPAFHNNIFTFTATGTGIGTATQTSDRTLLLDGAKLGLASGGDKIMGLHVLTQATAFNGKVLAAGTVLVSIDGGTHSYAGVTETAFDVVALTATGTGAATAGTGQLLFDGSDLGLDSVTGANTAAKNLQGLTVYSSFVAGTPAANAAPVLSGANNLATIAEDPASNPGTLVSALISGRISDADAGAVGGIAVTGVNDTNGAWQYSLDGSTWLAFAGGGTVPADATARLLAADGLTAVRFVPNADWNGSVAAGLAFRAWDRTSGTAGTLADARVNGAATAFSSATAASSITVTAVNDAPTLDAAGGADRRRGHDARLQRRQRQRAVGGRRRRRQRLAAAHADRRPRHADARPDHRARFRHRYRQQQRADDLHRQPERDQSRAGRPALPPERRLQRQRQPRPRPQRPRQQRRGGAKTATGSMVLTITAVNDAPVLGVPGAQSTPQSMPIAFSAASGNAITLSDVDAGNVAAAADARATACGNGTLSFGSLGGLCLVSSTGTRPHYTAVTLQGSMADLNAALDTMSLHVDGDARPDARIDLIVNDLGNTGAGGAQEASGAVDRQRSAPTRRRC